MLIGAALGFCLTMAVIYGFFYSISIYASWLMPEHEKSFIHSTFFIFAFFIGMSFVGGILGAIIGYAKAEIHLEKCSPQE